MAQTATNQPTDHADLEKPSPVGSFCWNELNVPDIEAAMQFYAHALGWTFHKFDMPEPSGGADRGAYWIASTNGKEVAGVTDMGHKEDPDLPPHWLGYIAVDDVDARVAKAETLGAKIMMPPMDIPKVGRIAILIEPGGAAIGWMTPAPQ